MPSLFSSVARRRAPRQRGDTGAFAAARRGVALRPMGVAVARAVSLATLFAPLAALVALAAGALAEPREVVALALPTGRRLTLLAQGVGFAVAVTAAGVAVGVLAAVALWRLPARPRALARGAVWVAAFVPPYVHSLAWMAVAARTQALMDLMGLPRLPWRGWGIAWWVQLMSLAPLAVGLALAGLEAVDRDAVDAARPLRPDLAVLTRVVLPMAAPLVVAGGALLFLLTMNDYAVPSLFQVGVYAMELLTEFSANHAPARALFLALPLLALAAVTMGALLRLLPRVPQRPLRTEEVWRVPPRWPRGMRVLQALAGVLLGVQFAVPLVVLIGMAATEPALGKALYGARRDIAYSLGVAVGAAVASLPIALILGPLVARRRAGWAWLLVALPIAVPAPLVGIGLITLWNRPGLDAVYGSSVMPVFAAVARFAPLAVAIVAAQWRRVDPALIDVARVLQARPRQAALQVTVPLLAPGCIAGACAVMALTLGELGATLLVVPPGRATLTLRIYNYLHYGATGDVAGLCLVMLALALLIGAGVLAMLTGWGRTLPDDREAAR